MEVKPGYKQTTEMGVIPEGCEIKRLGDVATFHKGKGLPKSALTPYGSEPCIHYGELFTQYGESIHETISRTNKSQGNFRSVANDVLMPTSDVTPRGLAKASCVIVDDVVLGGDILVIRTDPAFISGTFLSHVIRRDDDQVLRLVTGTTVFHLYGTDMKKFTFKLPPLAEQRAIATTLSDVDALLGGLDRLIAKKRDLKQATMQQLLTGQTRLPGFDGKWEVKRLGEVAHIKTGSRNNENKIEDGDYPFFVRSEIVERINTYSHDCEAILVPGEGRIGDIFHYINGHFDVHQRVYAITQFKPDMSARFVHSYMAMHFGAWAMQNTVKATVDSLRLPTFQTFEMCVPPTLAEQTAIAAILSDMDAELAALEARRDKTRDLKQAMMQELLTGKTRLVTSEVAHA